MSTVGGTEDVLRQVNQFWSMLDDLSENDAAGYRKFIEKQMKSGADFTAPPELHSRVRTHVLVSMGATQVFHRRKAVVTYNQHLFLFT